MTGCATFSGTRTDKDFETYAKDVFRHQNRIGNQLLFLIMDNNDDERLLQAEQRLLDACQELNNMAIRKMQRQGTNPITKYKTRLSVKECDQTSRDVELLLKKHYFPADHTRRNEQPAE
ncbi:MAG: hypothetical protein WD750_11600 [Gammaproteobacteria bacterium]